ncbi:3-oxoacyl-[acyl-carrier-protein] synthase-3 [Acetomicrobium thermoterrenum DSM 13490]|uniref:Beta-ketoacyl-[acyl-carrier-protein] synthase III n=1 Tax=Acetomicrobium thermoterrenum DSM 13490 TaxID=1120987 RepID=A0A1H3DNG0_9BACT|nr:beta-ketoacyl-ACP synthase III [Acetomicrobium thermoterrenum]SDX67194.1 3-oxoacyl-[acyl-carrier-protein] synthase-3 [Acetomicrobium thermoterrenum DSM 13490]
MGVFNGRPVSLLGSGMYVPEKVLTNKDLEKIVDTNDEWIRTRTGIVERRVASDDQVTSDLAYLAALEALRSCSLSPEDLDMVIVATNTPDTIFPSVAAKVQGKLAATKAGASDIQSGCTSSVYALTYAAAGIASFLWERVLVIGAEILTRLLNWEDRSTCVLFGDGAGAVVLGVSPDGKNRVISASLRSDGTKSDLIILPGGLVECPASVEMIEKKLHTIHMKGNDVFKFVNKELPPFLSEFCDESGLALDDVDWWIFHQANYRIVESVLRRLGVSMDKAILNVDKYGNTSSASVFLAFHEAMAEGKVKRGDKVVMVSFGSGMTYGATLIEV